MVPQRRESQPTFISEYELRSTPLAQGQLTHLCMASHHRGGPFIISRMPWPKIERLDFSVLNHHECSQHGWIIFLYYISLLQVSK